MTTKDERRWDIADELERRFGVDVSDSGWSLYLHIPIDYQELIDGFDNMDWFVIRVSDHDSKHGRVSNKSYRDVNCDIQIDWETVTIDEIVSMIQL